jgi:ariadne-1
MSSMQVLSNSYAFAYFFFGGDLFKGEFTEEQNERNKLLFEDSQEQLATEVRTLMKCTTPPPEA